MIERIIIPTEITPWTPTPRRVAGDGSRTPWAKSRRCKLRRARRLARQLQARSFESVILAPEVA